MSAIRVAFFLPSLRGGGAERVMVNIARGFAERGLAVDMVLAQATGPYLSEAQRTTRIVDLRSPRVLASLPGLIRYLRRERPHALITASSHAGIVGLWARLAARVPTRTFVTVHNTRSGSGRRERVLRARAIPYLLRVFYPWADGVVAVSQGVAQDIAQTTGISRERVHVIYNPVVTPELLAGAREPVSHPWLAPGAPPVILGVGRLTWEKDFPTLIKAFALVRARREARLLILGDGPERPRLEALVSELRLDQEVDLPGFTSNPYAFMARAAAFVLSSASEGLPTTLIEALATGTPVVSTDCRSGPREILQHGRLGALVPVGDANALATAVLATINGPRTAVAPEAWRSYALDTAVDGYLRVLRAAPHA